MDSTTITVISGIATVVGVIFALVFPLIRSSFRRTKRFFAACERFIRDWVGEPSEPGRDAVPGVMERLNKLDGELSRNGGKSTKDVAVQTKEAVDRLAAAFDSSVKSSAQQLTEFDTKITERLEDFNNRLSKFEDRNVS